MYRMSWIWEPLHVFTIVFSNVAICNCIVQGLILLKRKNSLILWNPRVHYVHCYVHCVQKIPSLILYCAHTLIPTFFKLSFNILFPCLPRTTRLSLSLRFYCQNFVCISHLPHALYLSCPSYHNAYRWIIQKLVIL
jgi:hypothetical protein